MAPARSKPKSGQRRRGRPPKGTRGDTRQDLLDAALRLFARQGYAATTVRQIADEVGVRDSAIYAHFDAKKELLDGLLDESGPRLIDSVGFDFSRAEERHPADVLPEFFERLVGAWDRPRDRQLVSLMVREGLVGTWDFPGSLRQRLGVAFQRWAAEGILRDGVPPDTLLWELAMPLVAVRILHLNADATPAERREGRRLAGAHVDYFLATAVR